MNDEYCTRSRIMPEYLAPGVYVEEVNYRPKTIKGISTSIAGFVGSTRYGPVGGEPEFLTSYADYKRIYGGIDQLTYVDATGSATEATNYMAHAVRAFFDNGGSKLYVTRIYQVANPESLTDNQTEHLGKAIGGAGTPPDALRARFPGAAGNMKITFTLKASPNILSDDPDNPGSVVARGIQEHDVVFVKSAYSPNSPPSEDDSSQMGLYEVTKRSDELVFSNTN